MHLTPEGHPPSPLGSVFDLLDHLKKDPHEWTVYLKKNLKKNIKCKFLG